MREARYAVLIVVIGLMAVGAQAHDEYVDILVNTTYSGYVAIGHGGVGHVTYVHAYPGVTVDFTGWEYILGEDETHSLDIGGQGGHIEFAPDTPVQAMSIIQMMQKHPTYFRMNGGQRLKVMVMLEDYQKRIQFLNDLLDSLLKELH